jgi:hypothetical protein
MTGQGVEQPAAREQHDGAGGCDPGQAHPAHHLHAQARAQPCHHWYAVASTSMAGAATSQPTPQRLAAIREQLSLLADYL